MSDAVVKVLYVEDNPGDVDLVRMALEGARRARYELTHVDRLGDLVAQLANAPPDVILLDLSLPDSHGLETLSRVRETAPDTAIVVLTSLDSEETAMNALDHGAQDYLVKGDYNLLDRAIRYAIHRQQVSCEKQRLVLQLESANAQLEIKNTRLAELYNTAHQFVDNVSHEFRTPLAVIKEFNSIILDGLDGEVNERQKTHLNVVADRVDDLTFMVNDMLDTSRLEAGLLGIHRRKCQLADIWEHVRTTLERKAASNNISLNVEFEDNLPDVYCDLEKIGRVIINLVVNAVKFTDEGGQVTITAESDPHNWQVIICISDNGRGISPENLELIFKRFKQIEGTTRASSKGFGLGLNIAKELVQLNLGDITVDSQVGQGTSFSFTIPTSDPAKVAARYLKRLSHSTHQSVGASLLAVSIDSTVSTDVANDVNEVLHHVLRCTDVVFRVYDHTWLVLTGGDRHDVDPIVGRIEAEIEESNRHRKGSPLPKLDIHVKQTWVIEQDEVRATSMPEAEPTTSPGAADPVKVTARYLSRLNALEHNDRSASLLAVTIDSALPSEVADDVDEFLRSVLRQSDLVFRMHGSMWLLVTAHPSDDFDAVTRRVQGEWETFNQQNSERLLPQLSIEVRQTRDFSDEEVIERYLDKISNPEHRDHGATLMNISIGSDADAVQTTQVDTFLRKIVRSTDLVFRMYEHMWLVVTGEACSDPDGMMRRIEAAWRDANSKNTGTSLPTLTMEIKQRWDFTEQPDASSAPVRKEQPIESTPPSESHHILLIDDNRHIVEGVAIRLQVAGYEVMTAYDGERGLELAFQHHPNVIVLDIRMPGIDGLEVLDRLRKNESTREIPVVMMSASLVDRNRALDLGAQFFLEKPYDPAKLLAAIGSVHANESKDETKEELVESA